MELAGRVNRVNKAAFNGALPADAFSERAEIVSEVAANLALVDDAGQAAGAGQDTKQGGLGQAHRSAAVVHQDDFVTRQCELVATAGTDAIDSGEEFDPAVGAHVFHAEARLVGEFAEVHLERVARAAEHEDVGAGAENARLETGEHHRMHFRMLETQALQDVGELDVDPEIVGIQLQLVVVRPQPRVFADVHGEGRDVAVDAQLPVLVFGGIDLEGNGRRSDSRFHNSSLLRI